MALSAAHRQFLFPASIQQPDAKAAPSAVPGAVDDLITRVVAQPGAPGFVLPDSYVDRDEYRDFTEKACLHVEFTYAVPLLPYLVNVGKTRDSRVPSRGRPNHYFFARFPGRDTDTVFEVPHNGRAGRGASANVCLVEGPLPIPAPALAGPAGA